MSEVTDEAIEQILVSKDDGQPTKAQNIIELLLLLYGFCCFTDFHDGLDFRKNPEREKELCHAVSTCPAGQWAQPLLELPPRPDRRLLAGQQQHGRYLSTHQCNTVTINSAHIDLTHSMFVLATQVTCDCREDNFNSSGGLGGAGAHCGQVREKGACWLCDVLVDLLSLVVVGLQTDLFIRSTILLIIVSRQLHNPTWCPALTATGLARWWSGAERSHESRADSVTATGDFGRTDDLDNFLCAVMKLFLSEWSRCRRSGRDGFRRVGARRPLGNLEAKKGQQSQRQ